MNTMTADALQMPQGRPLTRVDLEQVPDDGHRYELLGGVLIVTPAPGFRHQLAVGGIFSLLKAATTPDLVVLTAPFDVPLGDDTLIQPDVLLAPREAFTDRDLPTAPLLAVEVLSPATREIDRYVKKEHLRRAGCPHYWLIDPDAPALEAWQLIDDEYVLTADGTGLDRIHLTAPIDVEVVPAQLVS